MRTIARRPSRRTVITAILASLVVALGACSGDDSDSEGADEETPKLESVAFEPGTAVITALVSVTTDSHWSEY